MQILKAAWSNFKLQSFYTSVWDAGLVMFVSRKLKRANLKFSKSRTPNASFIWTCVLAPKRKVHHTRVWRTWDLDFEVNEFMFYQVMWKARLQNRDAWIPRKDFRKRSRDGVSSWMGMTKLSKDRALSWQKPVPTRRRILHKLGFICQGMV